VRRQPVPGRGRPRGGRDGGRRRAGEGGARLTDWRWGGRPGMAGVWRSPAPPPVRWGEGRGGGEEGARRGAEQAGRNAEGMRWEEGGVRWG
jgi:hypothetical protein